MYYFDTVYRLARVGNDHENWNALGQHGIGKMNSNGLFLLQLCTEFESAVCNTFYQQKVMYKVAWMHPRSKHGHILDCIITRKRDLRDVCTVRVKRGVERNTYQKRVRGKLKICIKRKVGATGVKVPKRIDVSKLQRSEIREALRNMFDSVDVGGP